MVLSDLFHPCRYYSKEKKKALDYPDWLSPTCTYRLFLIFNQLLNEEMTLTITGTCVCNCVCCRNYNNTCQHHVAYCFKYCHIALLHTYYLIIPVVLAKSQKQGIQSKSWKCHHLFYNQYCL